MCGTIVTQQSSVGTWESKDGVKAGLWSWYHWLSNILSADLATIVWYRGTVRNVSACRCYFIFHSQNFATIAMHSLHIRILISSSSFRSQIHFLLDFIVYLSTIAHLSRCALLGDLALTTPLSIWKRAKYITGKNFMNVWPKKRWSYLS